MLSGGLVTVVAMVTISGGLFPLWFNDSSKELDWLFQYSQHSI